jgi:NAD dependent epimerase/dehydratase family enzyme
MNAELTRTLAHLLNRPAPFPVPAFMLRLAFGEFADEGLLSSARVVPKTLASAGFKFKYPQLEAALAQLLRE